MIAAQRNTDLESSTFQRLPAYRYIRLADNLPSIKAVLPIPSGQLLCRIKLFNPTGAATWWIAAYDHDTRIAFGVADLFGNRAEAEVGDIWMPELVDFRGKFGLPIERDLHWHPKTVLDILEGDR